MNNMLRRNQLLAVFSLLAWSATNVAQAGLVITPTFDSSINNDANAAAIKATINSVIQVYEKTYANPINVTIDFKKGGGLGSSQVSLYDLGYSLFRSGLANQSASGQADQIMALAHLPNSSNNPVNGLPDLWVTTANIKALGYGALLGNHTGPNGYDGIITLNTALTTPGSPGSNLNYSLAAVTMHEIDEVLGLGSGIGLKTGGGSTVVRPEDLYRYTSAGNGTRSFTSNGDNAYFSIDGIHNLVQFNQVSGADYGDWHTGSGTVRVQDAFGTPNSNPSLGIELTALDVIGYDRLSAVPEPTSFALLSLGGIGMAIGSYRRRKVHGIRPSTKIQP
jgi:hypothetical protein